MAVLAPPELTDRQAEVYIRVAEGETYPKIAQELDLTTRTVEFHVQRIKAKLALDGPPAKAIMVHARQQTLF